MDRLFDTRIQAIKYKVLKQLVIKKDADDLENAYTDIPKKIVPGPKSDMRCCIYKERAVLAERVRMAMGGDRKNPNIIEAIAEACDECPAGGVFVTDACRGCIAHRCVENCAFDAIHIEGKRARIDADKCKECGKCVASCSYGAIIKVERPCVRSCKADAVKIREEDKIVEIDNDKCTMCGACVYQCPWGALVDKSYLLDVIDLLNGSEGNAKYPTYAIIAPAIVSQFKYAKIEQIVAGIRKLGFHQVVEAALGADITLYREAHEFAEKKKMTTSCCPSFVMYIEKHYPKLLPFVSHSPSPMIETANLIKASHPDARIVFIGPCTSKKYEVRRPETGGAVDYALTFEELQAFLDARGIECSELQGESLDNASFYGRIFARSGGIAKGIVDVAKEFGIEEEIRPLALSGLAECKVGLLKFMLGRLEENFMEGMACEGGCINGAGCLHHGPKNAVEVDKYGKEAREKTVENSVKLYEMTKK